jgi:selenocysteine lyase/cysteine desulfurase
MSMDVGSFGIDFLLCSAYKFYGPHVGILYAKEGLLDSMQTDRLRTADQRAPHRIETGTLNHAALAGVKSAVEYIASMGHGDTLRAKLVSAMELLSSYEHGLGARLYRGLSKIDGVTIYGLPFRREPRAPTVSFIVRGLRAEEVCVALGEKGFCTWDGHFYAMRAMEVLGLLELGGVVRIGISLYTGAEEIDLLLTEIRKLSKE